MPLNSLLAKAMELSLTDLQEFRVYFKTCSMFKWEELPDLSIRTAEISSDQIVFLAFVIKEEADVFAEINCVPA